MHIEGSLSETGNAADRMTVPAAKANKRASGRTRLYPIRPQLQCDPNCRWLYKPKPPKHPLPLSSIRFMRKGHQTHPD